MESCECFDRCVRWQITLKDDDTVKSAFFCPFNPFENTACKALKDLNINPTVKKEDV